MKVSTKHLAAKSSLLLVAGIVLGGLGLTYLSVANSRRDSRATAEAQFERLAERLTGEVRDRTDLLIYGLKGARGVYAASTSVSRLEFRAYVESRNSPVEFPGVLGFGFIQRVMRQDLARFTAAERADQAPDFTVRTSGSAPDLYVVKYIDPLVPNFPAWGFDVGSEPVWRSAVERAVRTGNPILTGRSDLVQDQKKRPGFLYVVPVYRNGSAATTPAEREAALVGLVFAPLVLSEIFANLLDRTESPIDVEVFEGTELSSPHLLLDADNILVAADDLKTPLAYGGRMFHKVVPLEIGGQTWTLALTSTAKFEAGVEQFVPRSIGIAGTLVTLLVSSVVAALGMSRSRALRLADRMTADPRASEAEARRLAMVASRTSDAVLIADAAGEIEWVNAGFTRFTGYTLEDVAGRAPHAFSQGPLTDPSILEQMRAGFASGTGFAVEVLNYHKSGRTYWLEIDVQPNPGR